MYRGHPIQECHGKFNIAQGDSVHQKIGLKSEEETSKVLNLEQSLVWSETWTLREVDPIYLESYEMWCWRRMEKIGLIDRVRDGELHRGREEGGEYRKYNK
jgi:hypothetical protein